MLGRKKAGAAKKAASWRDKVAKEEIRDDEKVPELTAKELDDFKRENEKEEREERLKRTREILARKEQEEKKKKRREKKEKAFAWMESDDDDDDHDEIDELSVPMEDSSSKEDFREAPPPKEPPKYSAPTILTREDRDREERLSQMACPKAGGPMYKTRICQQWRMGTCPWGDKCTYAHGFSQLRPSVVLPAKDESPVVNAGAPTGGFMSGPIGGVRTAPTQHDYNAVMMPMLGMMMNEHSAAQRGGTGMSAAAGHIPGQIPGAAHTVPSQIPGQGYGVGAEPYVAGASSSSTRSRERSRSRERNPRDVISNAAPIPPAGIDPVTHMMMMQQQMMLMQQQMMQRPPS